MIYTGNKLLDFDYGAMEVKIIACYSHDKTLMNYIEDESTDMHRDMAIDIFRFGKQWDNIPKKLASKIRFEAKNGATFPWFYNSYFRSIARNLFAKTMKMECYNNITLFEHLQAVGIIKSKATAYDDFEKHIKRVEELFWQKFTGVKQWQEKTLKDYLKNGYIEQLFGFRISGYLTRNQVANYPIQGTAFHCLMWALNHINDKIQRDKLLTKIIGQIHDCCLFDLFPPEQQYIMEMSTQIATKDIRITNPWIIVPLSIEWEETEVNQPWGSKVETREEKFELE